MRLRFSPWDAVIAVLFAAEVWAGQWLIAHAGDPVPLHWGVNGVDRYGPLDWSSLIVPLLLLPALYVPLRLLDFVIAARREEMYGFTTNMAGGVSLLNVAIFGMIFVSTLRPGLNLRPMLPIGLLMIYLGWLLRAARDVPMNTAGLIPDTPEARLAVRKPLGTSFIVTGLLVIAFGFLPGPWAIVGILTVTLGPIIGLVVGISHAPQK